MSDLYDLVYFSFKINILSYSVFLIYLPKNQSFFLIGPICSKNRQGIIRLTTENV